VRDGWRLTASRPVGMVTTLLSRLAAEAEGGAVALGADLPIGLPRAYAATRLENDFRSFLTRTMDKPRPSGASVKWKACRA